MGLTTLEMEVANLAAPDKTEKVECLVDSGAVYSVVPATLLDKLGIIPLAEVTFRLTNGEKIVRRKGGALFRYGKRVGLADVVFGEEGDSVLLGALTLEALGLSLDPLQRELKELPMLLSRGHLERVSRRQSEGDISPSRVRGGEDSHTTCAGFVSADSETPRERSSGVGWHHPDPSRRSPVALFRSA